jgi:hypothetical protein
MAVYVQVEEKKYETAPTGPTQAVIVDVIDMGLQETDYGPKDYVAIIYQLATRDSQGKRFQIRERFTKSLTPATAKYKASKLRTHLESLLDKSLDNSKIDLEKLIGTNARVYVEHKLTKKGNTWASLRTAVEPWRDGPEITIEDYTRREKDEDLTFPPRDDKEFSAY